MGIRTAGQTGHITQMVPMVINKAVWCAREESKDNIGNIENNFKHLSATQYYV